MDSGYDIGKMAMKWTRGEKERWEDFGARVGIKGSGGGKKLRGKRFTLFVSFNQSLVLSQKQVSYFLRRVLHHPGRLGPRHVR